MQVRDPEMCEACPESYCTCYVETGICRGSRQHTSCFSDNCMQYLGCTGAFSCSNRITEGGYYDEN